MAEYIERKALLEAFSNADPDVLEDYGDGTSGWGFGIENILKVINSIPAADVAPVRHGRWIDTYPDIEPNPMFMYGICSECGFEQGISKYLNYCPNCGAKMDGGND